MLPSALLDLLSHRLSASNSFYILIQGVGRVRPIQQLAVHHPKVRLDGHETSMLKAPREERSVHAFLPLFNP
jgi:hypothetical protein